MVLVLKRYQYATISILLFYNYLRFWRQIGTLFCKKRIFCIKHNIWPPGVSMYGLSPMGNGINFEQLLICINFNMTFIINIQYFEGKLTHVFVKKYIFYIKRHIWPPWVIMYELTSWCKGISLEEISICYNFNITFVMIIYDFDIKLAHCFVKKRIFCIKHNFWPPGVSIYGLTPWGNGIYFEQLLICINFNMTFVINIQYLRSKWHIFCQKM